METKEIIMHLFENVRRRRILIELYEGKKSFMKLREEAKVSNNTTLSRDLDFLDSAGLIVNIFERTSEGSYSYYELSPYGKRIAQIVIELEKSIDEKSKKTLIAQ